MSVFLQWWAYCVFILCSIIALKGAFGERVEKSVNCVQQKFEQVPHCVLGEGKDKSWTAAATFTDKQNVTGWAELTVQSNEMATDYLQAYSAGYLEGALTTSLINMNWQNVRAKAHVSETTEHFILENEKWIRNQVDLHSEKSYWINVGLVLAQLDGMLSGYNNNCGDLNKLTKTQFMFMGMTVELTDFVNAADPSERPNYDNMTNDELNTYVFKNTHCSAMIKVSADLTELYAAHNTWTGYSDMLRIFKTIHLPFKTQESLQLKQ
jgi:hypothetical protein